MAAGVAVARRSRNTEKLSSDIDTFHADELTTHVCAGHVTHNDAQIWLRCCRAGPLFVRLVPAHDADPQYAETAWEPDEDADSTGVISLKELDFSLEEDAAYTVILETPEGPVGQCKLRTSARPERSPARITLAIASCHNPFNDSGETSDDAISLLAKLPVAWTANDVHHAFFLGDQVYTDLPFRLSLFDDDYFAAVAPPDRESLLDCTTEEVRGLLHDRYRLFWKCPEWRALQGCVASHAILDDHEIVDNFGTAPEHSTDEWKSVRDGAIAAFDDYQGARGRTSPFAGDFDQTWVHGVVSTYLLDIRSQRQADDDTLRMYAPEQLERLSEFLREQAEQHVIILGLSVPFIHVPDWMADVGAALLGDDSDAADRWSYFKAHKSRDDLLKLLHEHLRDHPHQRVIVVGGDIHVGCVNRIEWGDDVRPLYQIASSAITNKQSWTIEQIAELAPKLSKIMGGEDDLFAEAHLFDASSEQHNPYGGLNSGLVEIDVGADESRVRLSLLGLVDGDVVPVFESEWL